MRARVAGLVFGMILTLAGAGSAQVAWDAPFLLPPQVAPGFGLYVTDPYPGSLGVLGTWRSGPAPQSVGFRIGLAEDWRERLSVFGGVDAQGQLVRVSRDFPLNVDWILGAGLGVGEHALMSFPAGISLGRTFTGDGVSFTPYLTPRVILDAWLGSDRDRWGRRRNSRMDLNFAADLGVDIGFQPGWLIRFGGTFGDRDALAVGVVF